MKILFIANPESIFVRKLLENLERYSIDYGIYCCGRIFKKAHQYKVFCGRLQPNGKILKFL
ncbi:hypothetical protein, partial [Thermosipho africanus]|uniref:hypothetical protein n=1 Tax=Thermosipho africanus TaxID=2421 RepID=UPI0005702CD1